MQVPARAHSRRRTARSKPTRMADQDRIANKAGKFRPGRLEGRARPRPRRRRCRECVKPPAGSARRAEPAAATAPCGSSRPAPIRTAAISTMRALAGSSPVVSVSSTTASSAISGVALRTAIGCPQRPGTLAPAPVSGAMLLTIPVSDNGQTASICGDLARVSLRPRGARGPGSRHAARLGRHRRCAWLHRAAVRHRELRRPGARRAAAAARGR